MIGTGSIFASVTKTQLENVELICPNHQLIALFEKLAMPIDLQIKNLVLQNRKLKLLISA